MVEGGTDVLRRPVAMSAVIMIGLVELPMHGVEESNALVGQLGRFMRSRASSAGPAGLLCAHTLHG
jgi:hypothetical protein